MRLSIIATAITISTSLSLVGCDSDSDFNKSEARTAKISYNPLTANVSTPNNLLFNGSLDGTINLPGEAGITEVKGYQDISLVQGALDGWQLSVPFSIPLVYGDKNAGYHAINDIELDANSMPESVLIYKVRASGFADDCSDVTENGGSFSAGQTCRVEGQLIFDTDYTATFSNGALIVTPLKPFSPATSYMVVVTDQLKDVQGRAVATSDGYQILSTPISAGDSATVQGLKGLTQFNHGLLAGEGMTDTPIYSAVFTTQSVGKVLTTLQSVYGGMAAASALKMEALVDTTTTAEDVANAYLGSSQASFAAAKYFKTTINAPYYLSDLAAPDLTGADMNRWAQAKSDSPIAILQLLDPTSALHNADFANNASPTGFAAQAAAQSFDPTPVATAIALDDTATAVALLANSGLTGLTYQDGGEKNVDLARHLTAYNPIPVTLSTPDLAVDVYLPDTSILTSLVMPADGWPVVIFQHGITTLKETAAAIAASYVSQGFAVIAIDLPYHGSRGLDLNGDVATGGNYEVSASDSFKSAAPYANADAQVFANLGSFLSIRENLRQATADLFALRAALQAGTAPAELDGSKVHFAGQSLGSIVGVPFTALAGDVNGTDYSLKTSALSVPGAGLAGIFQYSPSFGPSVEAGLKTNAGYVGLIAAGLGFKDGNGSTALEKFAAYEIAEPVAAKLAIDLNYPAFAEVFGSIAQTVVDGADPLSYATFGFTVPTILHEVVGDGSEGSGDQTIPNTVANKPLVGTEPLIATLGLAGTDTSAPGSYVVRFNQGGHSSLISPAASVDVTVEMQTQFVSYVVTASAGAATVVVGNNTLAAPAR